MARTYSASEVTKMLAGVVKSSRPRVVAEKLKRAIGRVERVSRKAASVAAYQRPLRIIQPAPERGLLREWDLVRCRVGGTLLAKRCVEMQEAKIPSGAARGSPQILQCVGCEVGRGYRERLPGYTPPPSRLAPEVLPPKQRAAKRRWLAVTPGASERPEAIAPIDEAATLTPDDKVIP